MFLPFRFVNHLALNTADNEYLYPGIHFVHWNGQNEKEGDAASGIYICNFSLDNNLQDVRKLFLIR